MAIRLDPRLPLVWRTPDSLQLGVDRPPVVLSAVSRLDERLLDALGRGISRGGLDMIAATEGATPAHVTQLLDLVRPALLPPRDEDLPAARAPARSRSWAADRQPTASPTPSPVPGTTWPRGRWPATRIRAPPSP